MELNRRLLCMSYGKSYELLSFEREVECPSITLAPTDAHLQLPGKIVAFDPDESFLTALEGVAPTSVTAANTIPLTPTSVAGFGDRARHWVLELPLLDYGELSIGILCEGNRWAYSLTPAAIITASDEHFQIYPKLCSTLVAIDEQLLDRVLSTRLVRYLDGDQGPLWRLEVLWHDTENADAAKEPTFSLYDLDGNPIDFELIFFERQTTPDATGITIFRMYSLELFAPCDNFLLHVKDPTQRHAAGYCSINEDTLRRSQWDTWLLMRTATENEIGYAQWFADHQPTLAELASERASYEKDSEASTPLLSFVFTLELPDELALTRTILTLLDQSYPYWEALFVHTPVAGDELGFVRAAARRHASQFTLWGKFLASFNDERLRLEALNSYHGRVGALNAGFNASKGDWIVLLGPDVILEPNALANLVRTIEHYPEATLVYGDEDSMDAYGAVSDPIFKGDFNWDLLYSVNYVRSFLAIKRSQLYKGGLPDEDAYRAINYDIAMRAICQKALFAHVPEVLSHRLIDVDRPGVVEERRAAIEAERHALARHFAGRRIPCDVELLAGPPIMRTHYAMPSPKPKVSVIIPNKDHIDVLKPCVRSLLDNATYERLEIIIVENNSTDPATFALYDALQASEERVRVITWNGPFNYSAIINYGVAASSGDYLLLLNNDTKLISPHAIEEMLGFFVRPEVGVVGAKLYFRDHLVQHAGILLGVHGAVAHVNQNYVKQREGYGMSAIAACNFSAVTGACQMVSREVFDAVGGYEEKLATGFNDVDFCLKVQRSGRLIVFTPYAEFFHYEFTSRERESKNNGELARWERERAWMAAHWPEMHEGGDPYLSPNLDPNNAYYNLPPSID